MPFRTVPISRIAGIEVRLDPSMIVVVVLVVWVFSAQFRGDYGLPTAVVMATTFAVLFFATILAHELAHALEARHRDIEVKSVTLFLFGGVTEMHAHSQTPRDEFVIAAVGPWVSLLAGAVFGLIATWADDLLPSAIAAPVSEVAGLLGWWNVLLALFNIVPGAPLDGGRVLRAALWWMLGDRLRALRISVRAGQVLGIALIVFGLWSFVQAPRAFVASLLFAVMGGFLFNAARSELRHAELDAALTGRTVADLLGVLPEPLPAEHPLAGLDVARWARGADLVPVLRDGDLIGVIETGALAELYTDERSVRTAGDLAEPVDDVPSADLTDDLHALVDAFQGDHHVVRLTRAGRPIGAVTEREIARALHRLRSATRRGSSIAADVPTPDAEVAS